MSQRKPTLDGSRNPLGTHQSSWIWGRHLVTDTLHSQVWPILELLLADDLPHAESAPIRDFAAASKIQVDTVNRRQLESRCRGEDHQGYAAKMAAYPYCDESEVWSDPDSHQESPLYVILDQIQDPFNFGTMLRSAEIFGICGVLIENERQVGVTSQVARSSVGAVNRLRIVRVSDLPQFLSKFAERNIPIVGASEKASQPVDEFDFRRPAAIVIGNESRGLRPSIAAACTSFVRIPQLGATNSLNASAALAITLYEARRQQHVRRKIS